MLFLQRFSKEKNIHKVFEVSVVLKGVHALVEIIGGIVIFFISQEFLLSVADFIAQNELTEDPTDFFTNYILSSAQNFSTGSQHFVALYLLSHGIIKGFLVVGLLKEKLWAYPLSIFVFSLFGLYQIFRYTSTHSLWLLLITFLDVVVILLTWHEYDYMKKKKVGF